MEKEKIRFGRVIFLSILISILIIIIFYFCSTIFSPPVRMIMHASESQAHNTQFESYFGAHVSATEVKQLLSLVKSNNISCDVNDEDNKIYINSKDSTVTGINGIGIDVKTGHYYIVHVMNDERASPDTPIGDDPNSNQGYYNNGFIRNIEITLNEKASNQNLTNSTINNNNTNN